MKKIPIQSFAEGKLILMNKPPHWTSFDIVKKVRVLTSVSKVGHAGTLDPLASGLLIVCTGKLTKKLNEYMGMEKEYIGTFVLGATTVTYDLESEPQNFRDIAHLSDDQIINATHHFTGNIMQVPPMFSAIKKEGKPLYLLARQGKQVNPEPRQVQISKFEITKIETPEINFKITCSTGTYIRSLAYDFGQALGVGAYLKDLCRTRIGDYLLQDALTIEQFTNDIALINQKSEGQSNT